MSNVRMSQTRYNITHRIRFHYKNYTRYHKLAEKWAKKAERSYAQWCKAEDELYAHDSLHPEDVPK